MNVLLALTTGILFGTGTYLMLKHDLIRMVAGVLMVSNSVLLFIISVSLMRGQAPIAPLVVGRPVSDPVVQALALTAIVIGFGLAALLLAIVYRVYTLYGSLRSPGELPSHEEFDQEGAAEG
jgi:multicomponent Na+:H+ antiporter subunit C